MFFFVLLILVFLFWLLCLFWFLLLFAPTHHASCHGVCQDLCIMFFVQAKNGAKFKYSVGCFVVYFLTLLFPGCRRWLSFCCDARHACCARCSDISTQRPTCPCYDCARVCKCADCFQRAFQTRAHSLSKIQS